jgi:prophage tail gpP-like protein
MDVDADAVRVYLARRAAASTGARPTLEWLEVEPLSYEIDLDMLELADAWSVSLRFTLSAWQYAAPDNPIVIECNGRPVVTGLIDESTRRIDKSGGKLLELQGRDRGGRLVDSAAPLLDLSGLGILDLARGLVTAIGGFDLFPTVSLQNATNRRLMVGGGGRARTSAEPAIDTSPDRSDRRVRPGQTRAQVLEDWLTQAGLLGWSSADGSTFVVGRPNYAQEPQYELRVPAAGSARRRDGNVLAMSSRETAGDRYSRIIVLGSGAGNARNFGANVQRRGVALQGPNADGTGRSFTLPKDLIITDDDLRSQAAAQARADHEMALRESLAAQITATVRGHSQAFGATGKRANYAIDTLVRVVDEEIDAPGNPRDWLITRVHYTGGRDGQTSTLTMVPRGTDLRMTSG